MASDWLHEARRTQLSGPSFVQRALDAPDDDGDAVIRDDFPSATQTLPAFLLEDTNETLFQQFIRHWMNERHAPDILPAQDVLLGRLLDHVKKQVSYSRAFSLFERDSMRALSAEVQALVGYRRTT